MSILVTCVDQETGERDEKLIEDGDYVLICVEPCWRAAVQVFAERGTHMITVKDCKR